MFSGQILYLDAEYAFKEKQELTKKIKENGGQIAAVLSARKPVLNPKFCNINFVG